MVTLLPIIQADRDGAWPFRPSCYKSDAKTRHNWNEGVYDKLDLVQAFARHRLASTTAQSDGGEREVRIIALGRVAQDYEKDGDDGSFDRALDAAYNAGRLSLRTPAPKATAAQGLVEAGFDAALSAIRAWSAGFYTADIRAMLTAIAEDLDRNREAILAAFRAADGEGER